jgi:ABC-type glycerol-3-phosphate transport system substrate-binding protein
MNGRPIADTQGLGISSKSKDKRGGADFLAFLHSPERLKALYEQTTLLPADTTWNGTAALQDPGLTYIWRTWIQGTVTPYISNLMPPLFWNEAMLVSFQKIVAGELSGEQAAENAAAAARKWRERNPGLLEKYTQWANDLKL